MSTWADWDHIVKIDPDKELVDGETFADVAATGTDAIEIGGTTGMTEEKMARVVDACGKHDIPVYIEPSNPASVVHSDRHDGYLIPVVMNAGDVTWITGAHKEWIRIDDEIDWSRTFTEAYIVMNPEASVASYTQADCAAADILDEATLFYGGGIHDYESARTMATHADTIVVGDLVHDEGVDAVRETVEGARDATAATPTRE